jgi:O-succinylbenzoic acid--CoA ligase
MLEAVNILSYLKKRTTDGWLVNYSADQFYQLTLALFRELEQLQTQIRRPKIILAESDPIHFLSFFLACVASKCPVFLANPDWQKQELELVFDLVQPEVFFTKGQILLCISPVLNKNSINSNENNYDRLIMIPTGGTSGQIRFAIHTWETLSASVRGFYHYFSSMPVNSFCTLPLYHVSGLMQFIRSFITGGKLFILPCKSWRKILDFRPNSSDYFISLVPTQMHFLLDTDPTYLSCFSTIFVGGAPTCPPLLDVARKYYLPLAPTYGMTETASQIVTLKPQDFLRGNNSTGQVLPHAKVVIHKRETTGVIQIQCDSLFLGYYPEFNPNQEFITDDLGYFDKKGYLYIIGRNSQKIISGGENIFPAEVEAEILATQLVDDVCAIGLPDAYWGQVIAAVYVPKTQSITIEMIKNSLGKKLSRYKHPKYWLPLDKIPRNAQGKVNYQEINKLLLSVKSLKT